ncbi:hypothetical protein [Kibdelosporangium aridum]|uniref:hypothetical protein n=1 Tax=Kibdelosporangium aridum TaxID=2030 RepID=UPI0005241DA9
MVVKNWLTPAAMAARPTIGAVLPNAIRLSAANRLLSAAVSRESTTSNRRRVKSLSITGAGAITGAGKAAPVLARCRIAVSVVATAAR